MSEHRIEALRRAVDASPGDYMLRLMLAETLEAAERRHEALAEYEQVLHQGALPLESLVAVGQLAADADRLDLVRACLAAAREAGVVEGVAELQRRADDMLASRGAVKITAGGPGSLAGSWDTPAPKE